MNKTSGKKIILFRYVCNFSLCTHSGKQQYRKSCNVRLTAATHIRTYTINNTHTSSTDSKHNILQFDLAKKGKKNHNFFITMKEEACNCFTFRKKHVYLNSDFTSIYHQKVTKDKILAWIKDT